MSNLFFRICDLSFLGLACLPASLLYLMDNRAIYSLKMTTVARSRGTFIVRAIELGVFRVNTTGYSFRKQTLVKRWMWCCNVTDDFYSSICNLSDQKMIRFCETAIKRKVATLANESKASISFLWANLHACPASHTRPWQDKRFYFKP